MTVNQQAMAEHRRWRSDVNADSTKASREAGLSLD